MTSLEPRLNNRLRPTPKMYLVIKSYVPPVFVIWISRSLYLCAFNASLAPSSSSALNKYKFLRRLALFVIFPSRRRGDDTRILSQYHLQARPSTRLTSAQSDRRLDVSEYSLHERKHGHSRRKIPTDVRGRAQSSGYQKNSRLEE